MSTSYQDVGSLKYAQYDPKKVDLSKVAFKSLILGISLLVNGTLIISQLFHIVDINPVVTKINGYFIVILIFYLLEFLSTCLFNNSETDDDSFILNDTDLHMVHVLSVLEVLIKTWLIPNYIINIPKLSLIVIIMGQFSRTLAMYTARESFNHYIQREHTSKHKLVTWGIYKFIRHPSYFGFFWWFIGTQLWLGNTIFLVLGLVKLWQFFKNRIVFEEKYLMSFFGDDYANYRSNTTTGIPFVK